MKISIIGRGNAGCISAMLFSHHRNFINTKVEIELLYDSKIPPVPTGQGTTLDFPKLLFENFASNYIDRFPTTMKTGIMYEKFGSKKEKFFHPFPSGTYSLHFNPKQFQDYVCNNLKVDFKEVDENIQDYNKIDADYIIDCRGTPKDFTNYDSLTNPLNCALLGFLPKKENDVKYTRSIAHKNGWCFYIPLPDKTSLGYIFNNNLTSIEDAKKDFAESFGVEKVNRVFPFFQYIAKEPIIDNRILLNGNKLFFLEPLEATAMGTYIVANQQYFDYIFNNKSKKDVVLDIKQYITNIQDFILWHYSKGSAYNTAFWEYGKNVWDKHDKEYIEKIIKIIKGMSSLDVEKSRSEFKMRYGQWTEFNFDNWIKGTE